MNGFMSRRPSPESMLGCVEEALSLVASLVADVEQGREDEDDNEDLDWLDYLLSTARKAEASLNAAHEKALALREAVG